MTPDSGTFRAPTGSWEKLKPDLRWDDPIDNANFETICAQFAEDTSGEYGAAAPPIYQTSTFFYPDAESFSKRQSKSTDRFDYSRVANPTVRTLEAKLARLERGTWADGFASGMGAISAAINANVEAGSHVVCVGHCYGPTRWYLNHLRRFDVATTYVNSVDTQDFIDAIRPETTIIYLESPTSGRFEMPAVAPIASAARERGIVTIFDNSWATPYFCTPLDLGIDLSVHSASKYLNGHSDVVAGVVIGRSDELQKKLWTEIELCGASMDPFAGWLLMRGLRTLGPRMEFHQRSALEVARFLESHDKIRVVHHPGLESHPQHAIAREQLSGTSGLFSFELAEQHRDAMRVFFGRLRLFKHAVSWGGYESLIIGGTMFSDRPDRPEWLIRVSVGLESVGDLIADLAQALEA
jgi:cystathionine beta-lyase/cystathionine gamma-synthase